MVGAPKITFEVTGSSGTAYQVGVYALWEDEPGGPVRLWVGADDGRWGAFLPMTKTFIKAASVPYDQLESEGRAAQVIFREGS